MFFIKKGSAFTNKMHYLCQHSDTGVSTLLYFNYASSDSLETSLASGFIVGKNNISLMLG